MNVTTRLAIPLMSGAFHMDIRMSNATGWQRRCLVKNAAAVIALSCGMPSGFQVEIERAIARTMPAFSWDMWPPQT